MPITVTMIEEKAFRTKVRGYDPDEVDEFLDDICDEMIAQQETIHALREKIKQQDTANFSAPPVMPLVAPAPLSPTPVAKEALVPTDIKAAQALLQKTQRICDETIADAKKRAQEVIDQAKDQLPDPQIVNLEEEREKLLKEIEALKAEAETFRKRFKSLLQDQNEMLETELF